MTTLITKLDEFFLVSKIVKSRKMAAMLALGFSAGLPIMLVYSTLSAWLREADVSRTEIGYFVWVGFAYSLKFLWAPIVDRVRIPVISNWIGNRLSWTLLAIIGVSMAMLAMGFQDPSKNLANVAICAVFIAFGSATLDICVDAWRVDAGDNEEQATLAAIYQLGYRFGMIMAISGVLWIAEAASWQVAYWSVAGVSLIGAITPFWASRNLESKDQFISGWRPFIIFSASLVAIIYAGWPGSVVRRALSSLVEKYATLGDNTQILLPLLTGLSIILIPFLFAIFLLTIGRKMLVSESLYHVPIVGDYSDIVRRFRWLTLLILLIVLTYRISDYTMGVMAMPLYIDLGYAKDTIGQVKGLFGISVLIFGAFLGGWSALRYGLAKTLIVGAVLTILTNMAFAWLASVTSPKAIYLFVTIGADNLAAGYAGSVFIAFMSTLTNRKFTASQYALFSSLYAFSGKFLAGFSGLLADAIEYQMFFVVTALFGIPALIGVLIGWRVNLIPETTPDSD